MSLLRRLVTVVVAPLALLLATGLLAPVPSLEAYNPTATELQALGTDGVPFLRLGRSGTLGNAASPDLYLSEAPSGAAGVPPGVRAGAPPRWIPLSRRPGWTWFDQRLPAVTSAPPAVRGRPTATLLGRFAIPLRYGGSSVKAEGVVSYVPPAGGVVTSLTSPMQPALGLTVALLPGRFPDVYLQNSGTTTVTVLGEGGEPFAQIGPQGVRVNLRSPIHDADLTARGQTPRVRTDLSAAPLWQDVSATPSYDWFDPRPHFLPSWTIPLHLGARTIPVREHADGQGAAQRCRCAPRPVPAVRQQADPEGATALGVQAGLPRYRRAGGSGQGGADEGQGQAPRSQAPPGAVAHTAGHRDGV